LVSDFFQGKKNVLKLGVSQQFENSQFSGLVFTSQISKFSIFVFGKLYIYIDKKIDFEYIFGNL